MPPSMEMGASLSQTVGGGKSSRSAGTRGTGTAAGELNSGRVESRGRRRSWCSSGFGGRVPTFPGGRALPGMLAGLGGRFTEVDLVGFLWTRPPAALATSSTSESPEISDVSSGVAKSGL